ncbi:MAG: hypothetical protein OEW39_04250 [Deltaproteobacteria bacterium]|nr:hypothetical protein [Deltaproteobacteria bacterium]
MDQSTYPSAPRKIKFEETAWCYFYRTGDHLYKIRKVSPVYPNIALKERYFHESLRLLKRWSPELGGQIFPIIRRPDGQYALGGEGEILDFALQINQLSDTYWLDNLVPKGKLPKTAWGRLARFLAERHALSSLGESAGEVGRLEHFRALFDEIYYQSKKYTDITITQPMLEFIHLPMTRFLENARKIFIRRCKKNRILECHGAFVPEHIFLKSSQIYAIAPLDAGTKYRHLDAANDVASMVNGLWMMQAMEQAELFVKRYVTAAKDRDLPTMLPVYQTLNAMRCGVFHSERAAEHVQDEALRMEDLEHARKYFQLAVQAARQIPKEV